MTCFTSEGNTTSSESLQYRSGPGYPIAGPTIKATTINHTSVRVSWSDPPVEQLKGAVKTYTVTYEIVGKAGLYNFGTFPGNLSSVDVNNLRPSTTYDFRVRKYFFIQSHYFSLGIAFRSFAGCTSVNEDVYRSTSKFIVKNFLVTFNEKRQKINDSII